MESDLRDEGLLHGGAAVEEADERVGEVGRIVRWDGRAEVVHGVGRRVVPPPVVEAAAWCAGGVRVEGVAGLRLGAVRRLVVVAEQALALPLGAALAVGRSRPVQQLLRLRKNTQKGSCCTYGATSTVLLKSSKPWKTGEELTPPESSESL